LIVVTIFKENKETGANTIDGWTEGKQGKVGIRMG